MTGATRDSFRGAVMAEISEVHKMTNGSTPEHIIVSDAIWRDLAESHNFEKLADEKHTTYRSNTVGYLGMHVWHSQVLDERGKDALLVSEQVFSTLFPTAADLR